MATPTTITINFGASSTANLQIPNGSTYSDFVGNISKNGGAWITVNNVKTFVPLGQITSITAQ